MRPNSRGGNSILSEINVTPLVDVCLVLLIIFMLVTPLLPVDVDLPTAPNPERMPEDPNQYRVSLSVGPPPRISLGSNPVPVSPAEFRDAIQRLHEADPDRQLALRCDRRLAYGDVKEILQEIHRAGFTNAGLIAERAIPAGSSR